MTERTKMLMEILIITVCIIVGATYLNLKGHVNLDMGTKVTTLLNKELVVAKTVVDGFALHGRGNITIIFDDYSIYHIEFTGNADESYTNETIILSSSNNKLTVNEIRDLIIIANRCLNSSLLNITFKHGYLIHFSDKCLLNHAAFEELNNTILTSDFLLLNNTYINSTLLTDGYTIYITAYVNNTFKTVSDYLGCSAPENFQSISRKMDILITTKGW